MKSSEADGVLLHLLSSARSAAVRDQFLRIPKQDYTTEHELKLLVGSYNVNGRRIADDLDLDAWLEGGRDADVVAVGFQEVVALNASNLVTGGGLENAFAWDQLIADTLNGTGEKEGTGLPTELEAEAGKPCSKGGDRTFVQVLAKQLVGVYLTVWVRGKLLPHVRGAQVTSIGTGVLGYLGNKGAVAGRFRIYDTGLCFVCAHLSSGEAEGDELKRNYDYSEIVRRGQFPPDAPQLSPDAVAVSQPANPAFVGRPASAAPGQWNGKRGLLDCEHTIWLGDLNYRQTLEDGDVRALLQAGDLEQLWKSDELVIMMREKRAFEGWAEGPLLFPPTYKFKRGTDNYVGENDEDDKSQSDLQRMANSKMKAEPELEKEKRRTPAWTDRILWRSTGKMSQEAYFSADLMASDHRPVYAVFRFTAREYQRDLVEAAIENARRAVDALEMAAMPRCELEPTNLQVGNIYYEEERLFRLTLTNTGSVNANFQFMPLPGAMFGEPQDKAFRTCPRWVSVSPEQGELEPRGEVEIQVKVWVDGGWDSTADVLATAQHGQIDAVMVLRIQDGNDIFVSVAGRYVTSFFGVTISTLNDLPRPLVLRDDFGFEHKISGLNIETKKKPREERDPVADDATPTHFHSPTSDLHESEGSANNTPDTSSNVDLGVRSGHTSKEEVCSSSEEQTGAGRLEGMDVQPAALDRSSPPASPSPASREHPGSLALIPPEIRRLTGWLREQQRLATPGLFVNSADVALSSSRRRMASSKQGWQKKIVEIRRALDRGEDVPRDCTPHDVAATLLAFFAALPRPLLPDSAAQVCSVCVPSASAASSLLGDAFSPAEWAVFRHVVGLMRDALVPLMQDGNGLTQASVAALLAEAWFPEQLDSFAATGESLNPENVAELQKVAENIAAVAERRASFVALFLDAV